ncbi:MAG: hypothetical protein AAGB46_11510 [Verrucomicrobiota bacterium]
MKISIAEQIATEAHKGQCRRDGVTPYIVHPRAVVGRVGDDPLAQDAAWLHDTIEDTEETAESLAEKGIDSRVIDAVSLMTHSKSVPYETYLESIKGNPLATKVKIADMLSNLSDNPTEKQIRKYAKGLLFLVGD